MSDYGLRRGMAGGRLSSHLRSERRPCCLHKLASQPSASVRFLIHLQQWPLVFEALFFFCNEGGARSPKNFGRATRGYRAALTVNVGLCNKEHPEMTSALHRGCDFLGGLIISKSRRRSVFQSEPSLQSRHASTRCTGRRKIAAHRRRIHASGRGAKDSAALRNQVVSRSRGQRLNCQTRIGRALRWQHAPVADKEIADVMAATISINDRCARIITHADRSY